MSVSKLFFLLYWVWVASEMLLQLVMRTRRSSEVKDRGSLLLLFPVIFASSWWAIWYGETHARTILGGANWLGIVGLWLLIVGMAIRWTAIATLGRSFSTNVAIHATQTLCTRGLFRWVRHPSYTGMLMIFLSVGLYERNWLSLAVIVIFPTVALLYRIHVEEKALTGAFGADYVEYCRTTSRLVPKIY